MLGLLAGIATPATAQRADSLDLAGWLALARAESPALLAASASVREAEGVRGIARSARGPRFEAGATYLRFEDPPGIGLGPAGSFAPVAENTYLARAGVSQPLYTGGRVSATVRAAEWGLRSAELAASDVEVELTAAVAQAYDDMLLARALNEVARRSIQVLEEAVRVAEEHYEAGSVAWLDVLRAKTRLASAQSGHRGTETAIATARERLAAIAGVDPERAPPVSGSLAYADTDIDPDALLERARSGRPDVRALQAAAGAERARARAAAAERRPMVSLNATGFGTNPEILTGRDRWSWKLMAVLNVAWPMFDSGEAAAHARAAHAAADRAEAQAARTADAATAAVRIAMGELRRAEEDVRAGHENVERAERALTISQERYADGVGIQLEVLEAEADLTRARGDVLGAIHAHRLALIQLRRASGFPADAPLVDLERGDREEGGDES